VSFLPGILLAVLACAAADTNLARALHGHRPHDLLLPAQALLLWGCWALIVAFPARLTAQRLRAGFAASLGWLVGPLVLHQVVAHRLRNGTPLLSSDGPVLLALVLGAVVLATLLLAWAERRVSERRWPRLALVAASLLLLLPRGAGTLAPARTATQPSATSAASAAGRPNLLLLVWDTTRADHLIPYGYERPTTPHLDELARTSTLYENCWSASVFTLSSHVSMLTGLLPSQHGTTLRTQSVTAPVIAERLQQAGYRTGAFVGTSVLAAGRGLERGFEVFDDAVDPPVCDTQLWRMVHDVQALVAAHVRALGGNGRPHWFQDFERPADEVLAHALDFIRADDGRPWFALVNLYDVHWPYLPDEVALSAFVRPYAGPLSGWLFRADDWPESHKPDAADRAHASDLYDAELWDLDRDVDRFLGQLDLRAPNQCVLMTSDHGEGLGERDTWSHEDLFAPQTRVPLMLHAPGRVEAAARDTRLACGADAAPTLLELAGLPAPDPEPWAGRSLLQPPDDRRIVVVQDHDTLNPAKVEDLATRGRLLLLRREGRQTLHDVVADPLSETDLSAQYPEDVIALSVALDELEHSNVEYEGADQVLDNLDALHGLGYVGGR